MQIRIHRKQRHHRARSRQRLEQARVELLSLASALSQELRLQRINAPNCSGTRWRKPLDHSRRGVHVWFSWRDGLSVFIGSSLVQHLDPRDVLGATELHLRSLKEIILTEIELRFEDAKSRITPAS